VTQALDRVRKAARQRKKEQFTTLLHHINGDTLRTAFYALSERGQPPFDPAMMTALLLVRLLQRRLFVAPDRQSPYRLRKQLPEPVFGQIKQARGFRQFLLRNVEKVAAEWGLVCLAHNILKLAQGRMPSLAPLATG
jgi:hypothetical protein